MISSKIIRIFGFQPYDCPSKKYVVSQHHSHQDESAATQNEKLDDTSDPDVITDNKVEQNASVIKVCNQKHGLFPDAIDDEDNELVRKKFAVVLDRIFLCVHATAMVAVACWLILKFHNYWLFLLS